MQNRLERYGDKIKATKEQLENLCNDYFRFAHEGDIGSLNALISGNHQVHVNSKYIDGCTALMIAIKAPKSERRTAMIHWLVDGKQADINIDAFGRKAVHFAADVHDEEVMAYLISHGADPMEKDIHRASALEISGLIDKFVICAKQGDILSLQRLLWSFKIPIDAKSHDNEEQKDVTALMSAALAGKLEAVEWLIQHGANVNESCMCWKAIHVAAEKHHLDVMACLIRHGADPDEPNLSRKTAYELAGCDESQFAETATRRRFGY